jgi:hypothetical protein
VRVEEALPPARHPRLLLLVHPPIALLAGLLGLAGRGGDLVRVRVRVRVRGRGRGRGRGR